jgi:hypothetical protein
MSRQHQQALHRVLEALDGLSELNALPVLMEATAIKMVDADIAVDPKADISQRSKDVIFQLTATFHRLVPKLVVSENLAKLLQDDTRQ